ncbi:MAG: DUF2764 family protein [Bacteroidales bacterium]|nr:DUF2764 family protein [Bacteroidales bacterium]
MANYQYIIAGLPDFQPDFEARDFDYDEVVNFIRSQCSEKDCGYIDWLEAGAEEKNIGHLFYSSVTSSPCKFLRHWFAFDRRVREAKVAYLDGGKPSVDDVPEAGDLMAIFSTPNIMEREKQLDAYYWKKADDLVLYDLFDIDVILAFIAKARIVRRWNRLDPATGAEFFKQLVQDVRGTFNGVEFDPSQKQ